MLLGKDKLNTIKFWNSQALFDSYISPGKFVLINNVLRQYNEIKEKIRKSWHFCGYTI